MTLADMLTPKDTEELKPGFFVQKKGDTYRQIHPIGWNGKIDWIKQLKSIFSLRTFFTIGIILFLVWSYQSDVGQYQEFYLDIHENPIGFCDNMYEILDKDYCTKEFQDQGLCVMEKYIDGSGTQDIFKDFIIPDN